MMVFSLGSNQERAEQLWEFLQERQLCGGNSSKTVDVLAHSTGGITARYLVEKLGERNPLIRACVRTVTTLGTAHEGTPVSALMRNDEIARIALSPEGMKEFNKATNLPTATAHTEYHFLAGVSFLSEQEKTREQ